MGYIISPGPVTLLDSSSSGYGEWYRVHPNLGTLTFQFIHASTTVGTVVQSTCVVQASNDGVTPLETTSGTTAGALGTVAFNGAAPESDGVTVDAAWSWVRAGLLFPPG